MRKLIILFLFLSLGAKAQQLSWYDANGRLKMTTAGSNGQFLQITGGVVVWGSGGGGSGTVSSVTSANSDISVATGTTTPVLSLDNVNGISKTFFDPTSSIQTQLNSKSNLAGGNTFTGTQTFSNSVVLTGATATSVAGFGSSKNLVTISSTGVAGSNVVLSNTPTITSPQINTPKLNTTSAVGQVWTASNTTGGGDWANSSSGFTNPMTSVGDIIYGGTSGAATRLPIGLTNQVLTVIGGIPSWQTSSSTAPISVVTSSASTLNLAYSTDYSFTGSTATWTLPAQTAPNSGRFYQITVKNRGGGNLVINCSGGGGNIYDATPVTSVTITPGGSAVFMPDLTYFNKE